MINIKILEAREVALCTNVGTEFRFHIKSQAWSHMTVIPALKEESRFFEHASQASQVCELQVQQGTQTKVGRSGRRCLTSTHVYICTHFCIHPYDLPQKEIPGFFKHRPRALCNFFFFALTHIHLHLIYATGCQAQVLGIQAYTRQLGLLVSQSF